MQQGNFSLLTELYGKAKYLSIYSDSQDVRICANKIKEDIIKYSGYVKSELIDAAQVEFDKIFMK